VFSRGGLREVPGSLFPVVVAWTRQRRLDLFLMASDPVRSLQWGSNGKVVELLALRSSGEALGVVIW